MNLGGETAIILVANKSDLVRNRVVKTSGALIISSFKILLIDTFNHAFIILAEGVLDFEVVSSQSLVSIRPLLHSSHLPFPNKFIFIHVFVLSHFY